MIWVWWAEFLGLVFLTPVAAGLGLSHGRTGWGWIWAGVGLGVVWTVVWGVLAFWMTFVDPRVFGVVCETSWVTQWATSRPWRLGWGFAAPVAAGLGGWAGVKAAGWGVGWGRVVWVMVGIGLAMPVTLSELESQGAAAGQRVHLEAVRIEAVARRPERSGTESEGMGRAPDYCNAMVKVLEAQWRGERVEGMFSQELRGRDERFASGVNDGGVTAELEPWVRGVFSPLRGVTQESKGGPLPVGCAWIGRGELDCLRRMILLDAGRGDKDRVMGDLGVLKQVCRLRTEARVWGFYDSARACYEYAWAMEGWTAGQAQALPMVELDSGYELWRVMQAQDVAQDYEMVAGTGLAAPVMTRLFMLMPGGEWADAGAMMAHPRFPFDTHGISKLTWEMPDVNGLWIGLAVGQACVRYRAVYGRWPRAMDELVPDFLARTPAVMYQRDRGDNMYTDQEVGIVVMGDVLKVVGLRGKGYGTGMAREYDEALLMIWNKPGEQAR